jgi:hypothetical protein
MKETVDEVFLFMPIEAAKELGFRFYKRRAKKNRHN